MKLKTKRASAAQKSASTRDNFRRNVIDALKQRVAGICSNPACGVQTLAPGTAPLAVTNTGHAAHIHAAAPGGPRCDPKMTADERSAITNGIWLCASCATLIDRDAEAYPPPLLRRWRHDAETKARQVHGRRPPRDTDAVETLVGAMTGRGSQFVPSAISNTHAATQQVLQALDARFAVETSHIGGVTTINLNAKEPVQFCVSVGQEHAAQWSTGIESAVRGAREVFLPMRGVSFSGSRLLEMLTDSPNSNDGRLTISPIGKPAVVKLASGVPGVSLDDISAHVFAGRDVLRFEGSLYASLIDFELSVQRSGQVAMSPQITVGFALARWHGQPVAELGYLNKVLGIIRALAGAATFRVELEVEGNIVLGAKKPTVHESEYFKTVETVVHYIHRAKTLAAFCGVQVAVDLGYAFDAEEHEQLAEAVDVIEGCKTYGPEAFPTPPEATVISSDLIGLERMIKNSESSVWKIEQPSQTIRVFGTEIQLPPLEVLFLNSRVRIVNKRRIKKAPGGSEAVLRFEPTPEFRCIFQFAGQNRDG